MSGHALAQSQDDLSAVTTPPVAAQPATWRVGGRPVVTLRAMLLGDSPADRVQLADQAFARAMQSSDQPTVKTVPLGESVRFELAGETLFYLVPGDLTGPRPAALLESSAREVTQHLEQVVTEAQERNNPRLLAWGAVRTVGATAVAFLLLLGVVRVRRWLLRVLYHALRRLRDRQHAHGWAKAYWQHALAGTRMAAALITWVVCLVIVDLWLTYSLHQFVYTRPWSEQVTQWVQGVVVQLLIGAAGALPGLFVAALIALAARLLTQLGGIYLDRIARGESSSAWLDRDTALPTKRVGNVVVWLFALAMAYPYLPGAQTEAFKGLSVLAGVMLSLGASSIVGQALSGLSLMYSRAVRVGEYVKIGDNEGTVTNLGLFTLRLQTGMGEEVSLPNTVVLGQPIRNFSRLVQDGRFMLQTGVTIGYSTPWRQVHAMLLEAATRTPGVAATPRPYVIQTALSDFYIEYRLCAQTTPLAPERRAEALNLLHGNILDVFNEQSVQIMSPHYLADPPAAQVVPPGGPWS